MNILHSPIRLPNGSWPYVLGIVHASLVIALICIGVPAIGASVGIGMLLSFSYMPEWVLHLLLWGIYLVALMSASVLLRTPFRSLPTQTAPHIMSTGICMLSCIYICFLSFSEMRAGIVSMDTTGVLLALSWLILPIAHLYITRYITHSDTSA